MIIDQTTTTMPMHDLASKIDTLIIDSSPVEQAVSTIDITMWSLYLLIGSIVAIAIPLFLSWHSHRKNRKMLESQYKESSKLARERFVFEKDLAKLGIQDASSVSDLIASRVYSQLQNNPKWASKALSEAKIYPYNIALFGERTNHNKEEKIAIAKELCEYLVKRMMILKNSGEHNYFQLYFDAGTTLYPFFEELAETLDDARYKNLQLEVVTNNLPGVQRLIRRTEKGSRSLPDTEYLTICAPGEVRPKYSTVSGKMTSKFIRKRFGCKSITFMRKIEAHPGRRKESYVNQHEPDTEKYHDITTYDSIKKIAVITGNWIRLRAPGDGIVLTPIPMAREGGHRNSKMEAFAYADEVYVVAPLSKVIMDKSESEINELISSAYGPNDQPIPYCDIDTNLYKVEDGPLEEMSHKAILVTTRRTQEGSPLRDHSLWLEGTLTNTSESIRLDHNFKIDKLFKKSHHLVINFDPTIIRGGLKATEIPHMYMREDGRFNAFYEHKNQSERL